MLLKQLGYLVTLSREKHFGRAALACNISQPALSGAIRSVEQELELTIVRRGQRFEGFTPEGEKVLAWARRMLADCEGMRQELRQEAGSPQGTLRIGAIPTTISLIPLFTQECVRHLPRVRHQVHSLSTTEILKRLESFELDLGISYLDGSHGNNFDGISLFSEHYVFITRDEALLEGRSEISVQDAAAQPLCMLTSDMHARRSVDAFFQSFGISIAPVVETDSIFALYAHVRCAGLCSIVPHSILCLEEMRQELSAVPLSPTLRREVGLILLKQRQRSPVLKAATEHFLGMDLRSRVAGLGQYDIFDYGAAVRNDDKPA
ncbi:LysR family transcriptional regulator [Pollutimonas bauzanensis]|uniref:DNA-binding transcriptional regulator, LysR family n=1 Tax=Pollutimonas bauzanensis TaxID=658167 RepID=A0A1M5QBG5_9BURK|nr:LysR family transcriptional regulator [Pollutimonas bauzanensis]SHH11226.1 DNA-binding transcriptional regulator, LysR family [Pollutimonas bauzanensis]